MNSQKRREANRRYYKNHPEISKAASRKWKSENRERINQYKRDYYKLHPEKSKEEVARYIGKNIDKVKARRHKYYLDNIKKFKEVSKKRYAAHTEEIKAKVRKWVKDNPEKARAQSRLKKIRYRKNPMKQLNFNISYGIWLSLSGSKKHQHWEDLVGYTAEQLKQHLENQFTSGMTWDNYGEWHIDHKIPKSVYNFTSPENIDFKRCWALDNLQPMWAKENISKGASLQEPFQPSLLL